MRRGEQRHLIFATRTQLTLLARCRRWYIDGTFKVIAKPFTQLLSIHGFLKKDDMMKQVIVTFMTTVMPTIIFSGIDSSTLFCDTHRSWILTLKAFPILRRFYVGETVMNIQIICTSIEYRTVVCDQKLKNPKVYIF